MRHLNGDVMCSIWIETTGRRAGYDNLVRVCMLVLNNHIEPSDKIMPFYLDIIPKRKENIPENYKGMTIPKIDLFRIMYETGVEESTAADRFDEWFELLRLGFMKQIVPLVFDWCYIYTFLVDWLGYEHVKRYFSTDVRDVHICSVFANDKSNIVAESAPYPKNSWNYLCSQCKVHRIRSDEAIKECYNLSLLYKRMVTARF